MKIQVNTQSSIKIIDKKIIYFDPFKIEENLHDADYIFITHDHFDHYDEVSIKKLINESTIIIVPTCLEESIKKLTDKYLVVEPNNKYELDDLTFNTIPSYNINKEFHPREKNYVGYLVTLNEVTYYIMGDTDDIEETSNIKTDICFVPIGGTYTMNKDEAITCMKKMKPKKVIPIHYGSIVGDITLGEEFKNELNKEIDVELLLH